jgi:hypothetical protein
MSADEIHPHNLLPQGQHVTGNKEVRDRNNDPPNLVGVNGPSFTDGIRRK